MSHQAWQITYEIHALADGRWTVHFSSPVAAEARDMLERLWERPDIEGLRLVKEIWDPASDRTTSLVLDERRRRFATGRRRIPYRVRRVVATPEPHRAPASAIEGEWPIAALGSAGVGLLLLSWGLLG